MTTPGLLVVTALFVAMSALAACSVALSVRTRLPWIVHPLFVGVPLLMLAAAVGLLVVLDRTLGVGPLPAMVALALFVGCGLIAIVILVVGYASDRGGARAERWSPGRLAIVAAVAVTVAVAGIAWMDARARHELARRDAALVTDRAALSDPAAADENAAPIYRRAFERIDDADATAVTLWLEEHEVNGGRWRVPGPVEAAALESALEPLQPVLDDLAEAADRPRCDFGHDPRTMGYDSTFDELSHLRTLTSLLSADAIAAAARGDAEHATGRMRSLNALAAHGSENPSLIGALVYAAMQRVARDTATVVSACIELDEDAVAAVPRRTTRQALDRALQLEHAVVTGFVCQVAQGSLAGTDPLGIGVPNLPGPLGVGYRLLIVEPELAAIDEAFANWSALLAGKPGNPWPFALRPPGALAPVLLPALGSAVRIVDRDEREAGLRPIATALRAHRQRTGAWPDDLESIGMDHPELDLTDTADPGGGMLRVVRDGDDLILYSVGDDELDDRGDIEGNRPADHGLRLAPCASGVPGDRGEA